MSKALWRGRPIEELTREELEDALVTMIRMWMTQYKQHEKDIQELLND